MKIEAHPGGRLLAVWVLLAAAHLTLLRIGDLAARVEWTVAVVLVASLALWLGTGWVRRVPLSATTVIGGALLLRIILIPLAPTLSDDLLRYLWDGEVLAAGSNPYRLTPDAPELEPLRDERWEQLPHRDVATVYPPLALSSFALASRLPHPRLALKLLFVAVDLLLCRLLLEIADRRRVARSRVLLYAWNPLVTLEIAGMGHVDGLAIAAVAVVVLLLAAPRPPIALIAVAASAAVLAKVVPLVAWPAWARRSRRPWLFLVVGGGVLTAAWLPVLLSVRGIPSGYIRFGISWEFNGPLFEPLWRLFERAELRRIVEAALDFAKATTGWHELWNALYPFNYPQLTAKLLLGLASVPFFIRAWARSDPIRSTRAVFSVLILFSATVYPWYALWVVPWAALEGRWSWILLAGLMPLSYLPQFLDLELFPGIFCAIWIPFLVALIVEDRWFAR